MKTLPRRVRASYSPRHARPSMVRPYLVAHERRMLAQEQRIQAASAALSDSIAASAAALTPSVRMAVAA